jgi:hypothetical protein
MPDHNGRNQRGQDVAVLKPVPGALHWLAGWAHLVDLNSRRQSETLGLTSLQLHGRSEAIGANRVSVESFM